MLLNQSYVMNIIYSAIERGYTGKGFWNAKHKCWVEDVLDATSYSQRNIPIALPDSRGRDAQVVDAAAIYAEVC